MLIRCRAIARLPIRAAAQLERARRARACVRVPLLDTNLVGACDGCGGVFAVISIGVRRPVADQIANDARRLHCAIVSRARAFVLRT